MSEQEQNRVQATSGANTQEPCVAASSATAAKQVLASVEEAACPSDISKTTVAAASSTSTSTSTSTSASATSPSSQPSGPLSEDERIDPQSIMEGLPPVNWGALFMPPIWGPAHGIWLTILYYPVWLLADNLFYSAYSNPSPLSTILSVLTVLILAAATIVFARAGQEHACRRALVDLGKTKQWYRDRQKIWAIAMALVAVVFLIAATYYNLVIRPTLGA